MGSFEEPPPTKMEKRFHHAGSVSALLAIVPLVRSALVNNEVLNRNQNFPAMLGFIGFAIVLWGIRDGIRDSIRARIKNSALISPKPSEH